MVKYFFTLIFAAMRPQKVQDSELLQGMISVFRAKGYEGASLNDLAASSGLKKASLYHRYPKGKEQIAQGVLHYIDAAVEKDIHGILTNVEIAPRKRLAQALKNIDRVYNGGQETCILRALSMDSGKALFGKQIQTTFQRWIDGFTALGLSLGKNKKEATSIAEQTLILIQGSLIVGKGIEKVALFQNAISNIKTLYK